MYGYTMHVPAPIHVYHAMHKAVMEVADEVGGVEGLLLHMAYPTDQGFDVTEVWETRESLDAFNRDVFPQAMSRSGVSMDGPPPEAVEFIPAVVVTARTFNSDAVLSRQHSGVLPLVAHRTAAGPRPCARTLTSSARTST